MKYLMIENKGVLPQSLFFLIGASTKSEDSSKFGEFGTGLKYAISYCARTETNLKMFLGVREVVLSTQEKIVKNNKFTCIFLNSKNTNLTTKFGETWQAWMALRELWCNAIDETKPKKEIVEEEGVKARPGYTRFFVSITEDIQKVLDSWEDHFLTRTDALYEDEDIVIYPSLDKKLRIYKNTILISAREQDSLFHYDLKKAEINELREYTGSLSYEAPIKLMTSNKKVIEILLSSMNSSLRSEDKKRIFEHNLEYDNWRIDYDGNLDKIKELFTGNLYISNKSSRDSKYGIMVTDSLLKVLEKAGLKTRIVHYSSGYGYYGSTYADYELVPHPRLEEKIEKILEESNLSIPFDTIVPVNGSDFDFLYKDKKVLFNTKLEYTDDRELKAIIMSAYIIEKDKNYLTLKRVIKTLLSNKKRLKAILGL